MNQAVVCLTRSLTNLKDKLFQIRISNRDVALTEEVRVQNEVAAIHLFRQALSSYPTHIVPDVYGWACSSPTSHGWILQEHMPGTDPEKPFQKLPLESQRKIMSRWATLFALIQKFRLPPSITGYGGLVFSANGDLNSAPLTVPFGGPFPTWQDYYLGIFTKQLEIASATPLVGGWPAPLRTRLENFLSSPTGISSQLSKYTNTRQTIVHGEFHLVNMLFDPETLQITALLDYDFAHVASPLDEYLWSFPDVHGLLAGMDNDDQALKILQLEGFIREPDEVIKGLGHNETPGENNWVLAKAWDEELAKAGVERIADIEGAEEVGNLYWFLQFVCPPEFLLERWRKRFTVEELVEQKMKFEKKLDKYLMHWGF
jgi:hypothetical protein